MIEATVKGIADAVFSQFRGGRERRIAFAKERVAPVERYAAAKRRHLERIAGELTLWGSDAEYTQEAGIRARRAWQELVRALRPLEEEARPAARLIDRELFRLIEEGRREAWRVAEALTFTPAALRWPPAWHNAQPFRGPGGHLMVPEFPPERPGAPVRVILQQIDRALAANDRIAERERRLLT